MFGGELRDSVVHFFTDNMAVKCIINSCTSKDPIIMHFLRKLILLLIQYNIDLRASHVKGVKNVICDAISRFQVSEDFLLKNGLQLTSSDIPEVLTPKDSYLQLLMT